MIKTANLPDTVTDAVLSLSRYSAVGIPLNADEADAF